MQDVSPWPTSFDVSEPVARVLIDGQEVDVESVEVSSELDSAMPERVAAGGGGVVAATGSVTVLPATDLSHEGFNPWGSAHSLSEANEVVVEAGYREPVSGQVRCARQLTGQVEALSGTATGQSMDMEVVDHTPSLDRSITIEPLMQQYPPVDDYGPRLGAGLSTLYVTNRVVRHCGFYSTPPMVPQALLSAPLFGSGVPERGRLILGNAASNSVRSAAFAETPWGLGLSDGMLVYTPNLGSRGHGRLTSTLHVSFCRSSSLNDVPGDSIIELRWGSQDNVIQVGAMSNGTVIVRYRTEWVTTTVVTLSSIYVGESENFTVLIRPSGEATIYASNGQSASGSLSLPPRVVSDDVSQVMVHVPSTGHRLGGVQVAFSGARTDGFQRSAHIGSPAYYYSTEAFPAQVDVNCLDLLKDQAQAELSAMWIDEVGHFRWVSREQLMGSEPQGTLTSEHDLFDLVWQYPVRSVFSRVEVEHETPVITRRLEASITVSDSRGSTLTNGQTEDRFFEPPSGEDWHDVQPPTWLGGTVDYRHLKRGHGSYYGGVVVDDDDEERLAYSSRLSSQFSRIGVQKWLLSSAAQGLSGSEYIEQAFRDRPDLYGRFAGENLPIIRAKGLVQWESSKDVANTRGPEWAPVFTHRAGPWVQNVDYRGRLVDFLGESLTRPMPVLRDVPIVPDPRIQLGDVFWLEDRTAYQVRLRVVVMGITLTYQATGSGHEMTQRITCRIIDTGRLQVDYQELAVAWSHGDYDAFETAWSGQDYEALENDPLERQ